MKKWIDISVLDIATQLKSAWKFHIVTLLNMGFHLSRLLWSHVFPWTTEFFTRCFYFFSPTTWVNQSPPTVSVIQLSQELAPRCSASSNCECLQLSNLCRDCYSTNDAIVHTTELHPHVQGMWNKFQIPYMYPYVRRCNPQYTIYPSWALRCGWLRRPWFCSCDYAGWLLWSVRNAPPSR